MLIIQSSPLNFNVIGRVSIIDQGKWNICFFFWGYIWSNYYTLAMLLHALASKLHMLKQQG